MCRLLPIFALLVVGLPALAAPEPKPAPKDVILFDFEDPADLKAWSNLELPKAKEPPVQIERVTENATSGKHSLKLTFAGGRWPTITTTQILDDWGPYQSLKADVTVSRPCVVGFTALQEKSERGSSWEALVSRWTKTAFLQAGKNQVFGSIRQPNDYAVAAKWGKVVRFEIFMYNPREGETIFVDNIRLSADKEAPSAKKDFTVAGTDWVVSAPSSAQAVQQLGKKFKDGWTPPQARTVAQLEDDFRARLAQMKQKHPKAVLAILRDGEKGYDPTQPEKVYAGWKDAYWTSHGPDSNFVERADNRGKSETHEIFMRHRSPLMRVDLSSIPAGATILAARLIVVRASDKYPAEHNPEKKATMWVVQPCNRPWDEYEVNAFQYAKDKFWKGYGGRDGGDDPDFLLTFLAYGPGQGKANHWDFTEAVRFWTDGKHVNHGFMLHGDSHDYFIGRARESKEIKDRPAVLVIYEPG